MCSLGGSPWPRENPQDRAVPSPEAGTVGQAGDRGWDTGQPTGLWGQSSPQGLVGSTVLDSDISLVLSAPTARCAEHPNRCAFPDVRTGDNTLTLGTRIFQPRKKKTDFLESLESGEAPLPLRPLSFSCASLSKLLHTSEPVSPVTSGG